MRKSNVFLLYLALNILFLLVMFTHASVRRHTDRETIAEKERMVRRLELTDLCLFTEASYTRHWSQADLHTPFQDSPMSLEHFPSGSILPPPQALRKMNETVD